MLLRFWRNPEFLRHVRAELRPARMAIVASLVAVICAIAGLFCWLSVEAGWHTPEQARHLFLGSFYAVLLGAQAIVLCLWWTSACSDAISSERALKTYDFLRTTRLTAAELMVGKLMGAPVVGLFAVACSLPVSLTVGAMYGVSLSAMLGSYALLAIFAPLFGLFGLLMSLAMEKPVRGAGFAGVPLLWALAVLSMAAIDGPFPGLAALSGAPAALQLHGLQAKIDAARVVPLIFGFPVSLLLLTVVLQASLAAWLVLMVRRNLKKEVEEISLLSRWQAIGLAVYLNFLFYAFFNRFEGGPHWMSADGRQEYLAEFVTVGMLILNGVILFAGCGMAAVTQREPLKIWWRRFQAGEASYLAEDGLPWPWLALVAVVSYAMLALYALALTDKIPLSKWGLGATATQLAFLLVFAVRDILFLQWCKLTRMKKAVSKGAGLLLLQYVAVLVVILVVHSATKRFDGVLISLLTPFAPLNPEIHVATSVFGITVQVVVCVLLVSAITRRLGRPVTAAVSAE